MILIISDRTDLQVYFVMLELEELGVPYGLFNVADYPTLARISQTIDLDTQRCTVLLDDGSTVSASSIRAVWFRKPDLPRLHVAVAAHEREFAFNEARAGLNGLYDALRDAYWMSPLERIAAAANKLGQLRLASRLGMNVPKTIFTNDAVAARSFIREISGRVVYKSIGGGCLVMRAGTWDEGTVVGEIFTTVLDDAAINDILLRLEACPVLFQEYIEKEVEIRVTVVGKSVFSAELHSQSQKATSIDWRQGDVFSIEHRVHDLPDSVKGHCIALTDAYCLNFSAIDLVKRPDGQYVFLELNPNGQYGWVEGLTNLPISKAIAQELANAAHGNGA